MNDVNNMETTSSHEQPENKVAVSAPSTAPKEQPKQPLGLIPIVALCLAVSFGASFATIFGYDRWYAQKIVAVDLKGYIAQQRDNYLAGKLNDDELKRSFDRLETVITAIPKNRVVIMGDAVVRNAETVKP
ncbi:hypothetical protein OR1_00670 [Geobacter sp. OR-1]|uniref:hypothetical protein n=1 Tax=Geobacter sp. OR-1 TaxID=1266765 RepID=UPI0005435B50|nr:hypothetical protein [Geobacter sp. OR-1]GAM08399.1 hypothetical protein OR1_00670 [Geobacter sp. OR-1]